MNKMNKHVKDELDYVLANRGTIDINRLLKSIKEKRFNLKDVGVTYRWISYWHSKELLFGDYAEGKWRRFDLIEFVWLKMIVKLREFNISIDRIKWIKENLIKCEEPVSDLTTRPDFSDIIMKLASEEKREELKKLLKNKDFIDMLSKETMNLFEVMIMDIITFSNSYSVLIGSTEILPIKHSALESIADLQAFNSFLRGSFISISISEILRDYMIGDVGAKQKNKLALLTQEEVKILEVINQENIKSVTIRYGQNSKIELLEVTKVQKIDKRARLLDFIMTHGYQEITIKTQDGEIVYCENKKKTMIRNKD
jgi:DNA-binding transcriptional MerR regulator